MKAGERKKEWCEVTEAVNLLDTNSFVASMHRDFRNIVDEHESQLRAASCACKEKEEQHYGYRRSIEQKYHIYAGLCLQRRRKSSWLSYHLVQVMLRVSTLHVMSNVAGSEQL